MDSLLVERKACPVCRQAGNDISGDNLALYDDGHKYCYACGYYSPPPETIKAVKEKLSEEIKHDSRTCSRLPLDISPDIDIRGKRWLLGYELTAEEIKNFWWSPSREQLIYPVFNEEGYLILWQARNFGGNAKTKYYSSGPLHDHFHILRGGALPLILVEDVVSAIKVSRNFEAMPLFGSTISQQNLVRLRDHVASEIGIWLDPDKHTEANRIKNRAKELGIDAFVIMSIVDPKAHPSAKIKGCVYYWRNLHARSSI